MLKVVLGLIVFCIKFSCALGQPGLDGGGMVIRHIINAKGKRCHAKDTSLSLSIYALEDSSYSSKIHHEISIPLFRCDPSQTYGDNGFFSGLYIKPYSDYPFDRSTYLNQRLVFLQGEDSMVVDFIGLANENPSYYFPRMDSLVFNKGYYRLYSQTCTHYEDKASQLLRNHGLTPKSIDSLKDLRTITSPNVSLGNFLDAANLLPTWYLWSSFNHLNNDQFKNAIQDARKSLTMGISPPFKPWAQTHIYQSLIQLKSYKKALNFLDSLIELAPNYLSIDARIQCNSHLNNYEEVLLDFDRLVSLSDYPLHVYARKATFLLDSVKQPNAVIKELTKVLSAIPIEEMRNSIMGKMKYGKIHLLLGEAYHRTGQFNKAFENWRLAVQYGQYGNKERDLIPYFDKLIKQHPKASKLYLTKALLLTSIAGRGNDQWRTDLRQQALFLLDSADQFNRKSHTHYERSVIALREAQIKRALKEINKAISKNNKDPRYYWVRYYIRKDLGTDNKPYQEDPDYTKYLQLKESWDWNQL